MTDKCLAGAGRNVVHNILNAPRYTSETKNTSMVLNSHPQFPSWLPMVPAMNNTNHHNTVVASYGLTNSSPSWAPHGIISTSKPFSIQQAVSQAIHSAPADFVQDQVALERTPMAYTRNYPSSRKNN